MRKPLAFKKRPGKGICPVFGCRRRHGNRKRLCELHSKRQWRLNNPEKSAFGNLRASARKRKIQFSLTYAEFLGFVSLNTYIADKGVTKNCLHIDRKDSRIGYVLSNLQILTCSENVAKENRKRFVSYFQEQEMECPF